jgi:uncharacterized protein (DUF169 family)
MKALETDLSVFAKFNFEKPPVGVTYFSRQPGGIQPLDKKLALCEMLKEAQQRSSPFYFSRDNEDCFGKVFLGMMEGSAGTGDGGLLGVKLGIFKEPRANSRLRGYVHNLERNTANYVVMAPFDKLSYELDLLIVMASPDQGEIILRAMTYSTGEMYESKATCVGGCSWLYVYPYLSGKVNFLVTGLAFGMKAKEVFPQGRMLISIPYPWIPVIARNLGEMEWSLPAYVLGSEKFKLYEKQIVGELAREGQNP